ncbi:MAG: VWA domain-containing protein [Acidobacteriota bacterium]
MRKYAVWVSVTAMLVCAMAGAEVQQTGQDSSQAPLFTLQVRRVPVDVVVTDKNGRPVKGLKKSDFIVREDNKQQKVMTFDAVTGSVNAYVPPKLPPLPVNTFVDIPTAPERGPLYVLYYDMVNTPREDQMLFHKQLLDFVDHAPAGVRMALFVNTMKLDLVQGFTSDHELLRQAILSKGPGPHVPPVFIFGSNLGRNDVGGVLSNLDFIAQYLKGVPGRKNLIWLSGRFPIPVGPVMLGSAHLSGGGAAPSMAVGPQGGPELLDLTELTKEMVQRTYTAMMHANIALYPVDLHGVSGAEAYAAEADAIVNYQYMDDIAKQTGGRAYHGNNHIDELITKAIDDGQDYYSLTYEPPANDFDPAEKGKQRSIEVSLANDPKGHYTLSYRRYYYVVMDDVVKSGKTVDALQARFEAAKAKDTLYANIEHGAPILHDLLFVAHLTAEGKPEMATKEEMMTLVDTPAYFKTRKKNKPVSAPKPVKMQKYLIDYEVIDQQLKKLAATGGQEPKLEFAAAAYDDEGRLLNSILNEGTPSGQKGPKAKTDALFSGIQELNAPAGTAYIRLAVRDMLDDRTGTLEVKLPLKAAPEEQASSGRL